MDIFVTEQEGYGLRFQFPMLPREVRCRTAARFIDYDIMSLGALSFPLGEELTEFSWKGRLPGPSREGFSFIRGWKKPLEIQTWWSIWRSRGMLLHLMVTGTTINHYVYLKDYNMDVDESSAYGDQLYDITFVVAKPLQVFTERELFGVANINPEYLRPVIQPNTHTVQSGDTLWRIAQRFYGDGGRHGEIYAANAEVIEEAARSRGFASSRSGHWIFPGMVLVIP